MWPYKLVTKRPLLYVWDRVVSRFLRLFSIPFPFSPKIPPLPFSHRKTYPFTH